MNSTSVEIGWIIADKGEEGIKGHDTIFPDLSDVCEEPGYIINPTIDHPDVNGHWLAVETHPTDTTRFFISYRVLRHGDTELSEPKLLGQIVRTFLAESVQRFETLYDLRWGIIETER